jgi:hypothetical protein
MSAWGSGRFGTPGGGAPAVLTGDADVGDVISGKTFYKDDAESLLTGTLTLSGTAVVGDVATGKTFYNTDPKTKLTGTR